MSYRHGVYISEVPTSIVPPTRISAGLPVVFGTAPLHLAASPAGANKPVLCYTWAEAVEAFGYSEDWEKYTLCEFMRAWFGLFSLAPAVLVNVLDPSVHKETVASASMVLSDGQGTLAVSGVMLFSLTAKLGSTVLVAGTDYVAAHTDDDAVRISRIVGGKITSATATLTLSYSRLQPEVVTATDIVGGVDASTGAYEGLELTDRIFPMFRLIPGMILAPGWSHHSEVGAVMAAKGADVNGHFRCISLLDAPTDTLRKYSDVPAWKEGANYTSTRQVVCWPKVRLGSRTYHLSAQLAGVIGRTDAEHDDVPYFSPSNHTLQADGAVLADGTEIVLGPEQAAYLNGQGIVTALNFSGGWKAWGNRTGIYPGTTDPKDAFIPVRRMMDWIGNTLTTTFWQKLDYPVTRRLVETVVDSCNIWLNGLAAREYILGGRVEFSRTENPLTDLIDGIVRFHVYVAPPVPAREIDFILEFDPSYFDTLFGGK
jgi:phage tail sheath protein FI